MDVQAAFAAAANAWGVTNVTEIFQGGQKTVAKGQLGPDEVVLKLVHLSSTTGTVELERCRREVALLKSISSSHVVTVLTDLLVVGEPPAGAMWLEECLDGEDLAASLGPQWVWSEVADLLHGVAKGLEALHTRQSVHRDLSPRNIRRTTTDWVVMDPGFAKHLERSSITGLFDPGTPGYMSPEHLTPGVRLTPAADVYGLGVLAYQALTGNTPVPFFGDIVDYQLRLTRTDAPGVELVRPDIGRERSALINRCLLRAPARRYLNASELLVALAQV